MLYEKTYQEYDEDSETYYTEWGVVESDRWKGEFSFHPYMSTQVTQSKFTPLGWRTYINLEWTQAYYLCVKIQGERMYPLPLIFATQKERDESALSWGYGHLYVPNQDDCDRIISQLREEYALWWAESHGIAC